VRGTIRTRRSLFVPSGHAVTDDDGYCSRMESRRHVAARGQIRELADHDVSGVEAKEVSARGAGAVASNVLRIGAAA
jgi:hypothetical protein